MASYARQADDKTLLNTAVRIQARAIRRCGELLKAVMPAPGRPEKNSTGGGTNKTNRKALATASGLSKRQKDTALRVASVPKREFEAAIGAEEPATVTKLAEMGKRESAWSAKAKAQKPPGFQKATHTLGTLGRDLPEPRATSVIFGGEEAPLPPASANDTEEDAQPDPTGDRAPAGNGACGELAS